MDFIYALGLIIILVLVYLNLKREKRIAKKELSPMNDARVINSYILIILLVMFILHFIFK